MGSRGLSPTQRFVCSTHRADRGEGMISKAIRLLSSPDSGSVVF